MLLIINILLIAMIIVGILAISFFTFLIKKENEKERNNTQIRYNNNNVIQFKRKTKV